MDILQRGKWSLAQLHWLRRRINLTFSISAIKNGELSESQIYELKIL